MPNISFQYIKNLLLLGGIDKTILESMRSEIWQENRNILIPMSIIATIVFFSLSMPMITIAPIVAARSVFMFLFVSYAILAGLNIAYKDTIVTHVSVLIFCCLLLGGGIFLRYLNPDQIALNFYIYLLIVSFLFTVRPFQILIVLVTAIIAFCIVDFLLVEGTRVPLDIVHTCVYAPICIIIAVFIMRIKLNATRKSIKYDISAQRIL